MDFRIGPRWSKVEDNLLNELVTSYGVNKWDLICFEINRLQSNTKRTAKMCENRYSQICENGSSKVPWTQQDDDVIRSCVTNGYSKWSDIGKLLVGGRSGKQCRERWMNHLDPNLKKSPWTSEEDKALLQLHSIYGNSWAKLACHIQGRSENEIKNRWNSNLKRKVEDATVDDVTEDQDYIPRMSQNKRKLHEWQIETETLNSVTDDKNASTPKSDLVEVVLTYDDLIALKFADLYLSGRHMSLIYMSSKLKQGQTEQNNDAGMLSVNTGGAKARYQSFLRDQLHKPMSQTLTTLTYKYQSYTAESEPMSDEGFSRSFLRNIVPGDTFSGLNTPLSLIADVSSGLTPIHDERVKYGESYNIKRIQKSESVNASLKDVSDSTKFKLHRISGSSSSSQRDGLTTSESVTTLASASLDNLLAVIGGWDWKSNQSSRCSSPIKFT